MGSAVRIREGTKGKSRPKKRVSSGSVIIKGTGGNLGEEYNAGLRGFRISRLKYYAKAGRGSNRRRKISFSRRPPLGRKIIPKIPFKASAGSLHFHSLSVPKPSKNAIQSQLLPSIPKTKTIKNPRPSSVKTDNQKIKIVRVKPLKTKVAKSTKVAEPKMSKSGNSSRATETKIQRVKTKETKTTGVTVSRIKTSKLKTKKTRLRKTSNNASHSLKSKTERITTQKTQKIQRIEKTRTRVRKPVSVRPRTKTRVRTPSVRTRPLKSSRMKTPKFAVRKSKKPVKNNSTPALNAIKISVFASPPIHTTKTQTPYNPKPRNSRMGMEYSLGRRGRARGKIIATDQPPLE